MSKLEVDEKGRPMSGNVSSLGLLDKIFQFKLDVHKWENLSGLKKIFFIKKILIGF